VPLDWTDSTPFYAPPYSPRPDTWSRRKKWTVAVVLVIVMVGLVLAAALELMHPLSDPWLEGSPCACKLSSSA